MCVHSAGGRVGVGSVDYRNMIIDLPVAVALGSGGGWFSKRRVAWRADCNGAGHWYYIVLWPMGAGDRPFGCKFVLLIDFT